MTDEFSPDLRRLLIGLQSLVVVHSDRQCAKLEQVLSAIRDLLEREAKRGDDSDSSPHK